MQWNSSDIIAIIAIIAGLIGAVVPTIFNFILKRGELNHTDQVEKLQLKLPAFSELIALSAEMQNRVCFDYDQTLQYLSCFYSVKMLISDEYLPIISEYEKLLLKYRDTIFCEYAIDSAKFFFSIQEGRLTKDEMKSKLERDKCHEFNMLHDEWPRVADVLKSDLKL